MKSKFLLLSGMATIGFGANAQQLMADYIEWPSSTELATYVNKWEPGKQLFEDENFFISRVKLKNYIRNTATQVNVNLNEQNDKNLIFWVPCGEAMKKGVHTDALPNGLFDNEVFSMWPYVTHFGDWTSPHGWAPGGFADAAHKHGTLVSGVASIPYGTITQSWATAMNTQAALDNEKLAHFLYYHGVNGLGYNSEFSGGGDFIKKIQQQHEDIVKYFKSKDTRIENPWYDG
ncbi:MAG: secretion protein, partial [Paramuribaculum sp.]|nr:secretion protein [Paramuribaculum sp.]